MHEQAPLELPELSDPRAERIAAMLRADPADRRPPAELAWAAGASCRTIAAGTRSAARTIFEFRSSAIRVHPIPICPWYRT